MAYVATAYSGFVICTVEVMRIAFAKVGNAWEAGSLVIRRRIVSCPVFNGRLRMGIITGFVRLSRRLVGRRTG